MARFSKNSMGFSSRPAPMNPNASVETGEVLPRPIVIKQGKVGTPYRPVTPTTRFKGKTR